jgi:haloacid dehalogenase-like hydrolase
MLRVPSVIAVIFDYDETLVPDSTTKLLRHYGIDPDAFWKDSRKRVQEGWDPVLAWLHLLLDQVGDGKPLGKLTETNLTAFGATLDKELYPGVAELFDELKAIVRPPAYRDVTIEFYIVSGGLRAVIQGSDTVAKNCEAIYGCELGADGEGTLAGIRRAVTFTEKTRYLFEIHKGLQQADTKTNAYLVNKHVDAADRRIPFENMIYVGDGLTDIPCFSLVSSNGGVAFGVFDPARTESAKKAFEEFLTPRRVSSVHAPKYRKEDELGAILRAAVAERATRITVKRAMP